MDDNTKIVFLEISITLIWLDVTKLSMGRTFQWPMIKTAGIEGVGTSLGWKEVILIFEEPEIWLAIIHQDWI